MERLPSTWQPYKFVFLSGSSESQLIFFFFFFFIQGELINMELLLQFGANPNNFTTRHEWTALHFCASKDLTTHAVLLFKRGANLEPKDRNGRTPLDIALEAQHAHSVTLLRLAVQAHAERKAMNLDEQSFAEALSQFTVDLTGKKFDKWKQPSLNLFLSRRNICTQNELRTVEVWSLV